MNKKGFTLIELLAVIVILAIIALIATPAVLNIIEDSRKRAVQESAINIARAGETYYMQKIMKGEIPSSIDLTSDTLKYNGEKPEKGILTYDDTGRSYIKMYMDGYCVILDYDNTITTEKVEKSECKVNMVILSIDAKGGEVSEASREYDSGDTLGELPTATRLGYSFKGWTLTDGTSVTSSTTIKESMTINASWAANTYTVTLSDGDNTTTDIVMKVTYDSAYGEMTEPTKEGYIFFNGWKLDDGTNITNKSIVKLAENHTLYAQWTTVAPDGTPFLFDPVNNVACSTSIGSTTGTNNGCMKWYAFLDSENSETVRLLLDHNITRLVAWNSDRTGTTPDTVNARLQQDVASWHTSVKSTARLIKAYEVNWIAPTAPGYSWALANFNTQYYFHTGTKTVYEGAAGTNKYAWLFDNTADNYIQPCTDYGCNVGLITEPPGYWTSDYASVGRAWFVRYNGSLENVITVGAANGVRPVIEVSKSIFE